MVVCLLHWGSSNFCTLLSMRHDDSARTFHYISKRQSVLLKSCPQCMAQKQIEDIKSSLSKKCKSIFPLHMPSVHKIHSKSLFVKYQMATPVGTEWISWNQHSLTWISRTASTLGNWKRPCPKPKYETAPKLKNQRIPTNNSPHITITRIHSTEPMPFPLNQLPTILMIQSRSKRTMCRFWPFWVTAIPQIAANRTNGRWSTASKCCADIWPFSLSESVSLSLLSSRSKRHIITIMVTMDILELMGQSTEPMSWREWKHSNYFFKTLWAPYWESKAVAVVALRRIQTVPMTESVTLRSFRAWGEAQCLSVIRRTTDWNLCHFESHWIRNVLRRAIRLIDSVLMSIMSATLCFIPNTLSSSF